MPVFPAVVALLPLMGHLLSHPLEAAEVRLPVGGLRPATVTDLKPHPSGSKTYNEIWTYQIHLEDGLVAFLNFSRVNLGSFKSPVCGADLNLVGFKGQNYTVAREYDKKNFKFTEGEQKLEVHENIWFQGALPAAHRVFFSTRKKDISYLVDLEFSDIVPGQVWGDGMFKMGSETVGIFIHIPRAKVSGKVAVNGDTLKVTGLAYMDHTFQTTLVPELVDAGYRYISQNGEPEVGYFLDPDRDYGNVPVGYGLRYKAGVPSLLKPLGMTAPSAAKAKGINVPTRLEITFADSTKSVVERNSDRLQQSVLHEFSGLTKKFIKNFMGGEIFAFKGTGTLNGGPAGYNFFIVDD